MASSKSKKNFIVEFRGTDPKMIPNSRLRLNVRDYLKNLHQEEHDELENDL